MARGASLRSAPLPHYALRRLLNFVDGQHGAWMSPLAHSKASRVGSRASWHSRASPCACSLRARLPSPLAHRVSVTQ
eukprot:scaffold181424_cov28-Tisochrysis_lutea.AAC.1